MSYTAEFQASLSSQRVIQLMSNFNSSLYLMPGLCDQIARYVSENHQHMTGQTVQTILSGLYHLGFNPAPAPVFLPAPGGSLMAVDAEEIDFQPLADVIHRDFSYMTGASIVRSCIALSFYRVLPKSLIDRVMHVDFMKRLENEAECSSFSEVIHHLLVLFLSFHLQHSDLQAQTTQLLNLIMQLNRSICLELPELKMPWFQQNYIEAQLSKSIF